MPTYEEILNRQKKAWGCPELLLDKDSKSSGVKIPFSSPLMDWATYGGIPRYRITEFCGEPGGGKSTTSLDICKSAVGIFQQEYEEEMTDLRTKVSNGNKSLVGAIADLEARGPKKVLYIDLEHSFDIAWATVLGLDIDTVVVMQPPDAPGEQILQMVMEMIETGEIGLVILDSAPSLVTSAELDKKLGERTVASLAGLLTVFLRKLVPLLTRYKCTFIIINQTRDNMDNPYVVQTPGGKALKFYASLRILFRVGAPVDFLGNELPMQTENPAGHKINAKIIKQKSAPWDRKTASYFLMASTGIRPDFDYANLAITKYGIIKKSGGWYTLCDPNTGEVISDGQKVVKVNGLAAVYAYLSEHSDYYKALSEFIKRDIQGRDQLEAGEEN